MGNEAECNMAFDAGLLDEVAANRRVAALRLYCWQHPAVTVGRFQNIERTVCVSECEQFGIPIVRRITGGRGILHGTDLTVALAAPIRLILGQEAVLSGVGAIYASISDVFLQAFRECGIEAKRGSDVFSPVGAGNCFALHSPADVISADGTMKLLGAALHRRGEWVLMQASIPTSGDEERLHSVFKGEAAPRALPADFDLKRLKNALRDGFLRRLPCEVIDRNSGV